MFAEPSKGPTMIAVNQQFFLFHYNKISIARIRLTGGPFKLFHLNRLITEYNYAKINMVTLASDTLMYCLRSILLGEGQYECKPRIILRHVLLIYKF